MSAALLQQYREALAAFDWQYDFADDHRRWAAGVNALARLRKLQAQADPDGAIWQAHPGAQGHGAPYPIIPSAVSA